MMVYFQLSKRSHSWSDLAYGINRFVVGLAKKVIIANTLGEFGVPFMNQEFIFYLRSYAFILVIAVIGSTPLLCNLAGKLTAAGNQLI